MKKSLWIILGIIIIVAIIGGLYYSNQLKSKDTIKIGAILPLSGSDASNGNSAMNGLILAQEEINNHGGISGHKIEIIFEDNKGDAKESVNSYQKLKNLDDISLLFTLGSPAAMALSPLVNQDKVLLFSIASVSAYSSPRDYTYRIVPSANDEAIQLANYIYNDKKINKLGVIYLNNEYGVGTKTSFLTQYQKLGGTIIFEDFFNVADSDMRIQIAKLKENGANSVYLASWGKNAGIFIKQAKELGLENISYFCGQACLNNDLIAVGGRAVEGIIFPFAYMKNDSKFYQSYYKKFGADPIQFSERMYDSLMMNAELMTKCKFTNNCILEELNKVAFQGTSVMYSFDENGDIRDKLALYTVKGSKFVVYSRPV